MELIGQTDFPLKHSVWATEAPQWSLHLREMINDANELQEAFKQLKLFSNNSIWLAESSGACDQLNCSIG